MTEKDDTMNKLTGDANYLGWLRLITAKLAGKGCYEKVTQKDGSTVKRIKDDKENEAYSILNSSVDTKILGAIPTKIETTTAMLSWLVAEFGSVDYYTRKQQWRAVKMVGLDPGSYFDAYNIACANYSAADGPESLQDTLDILLDGLDQDFYRECIRGIRNSLRTTGPIDDAFISKARQTIKHWYADTPKPTVKQYRANNAGYEKRHCSICEEKKRSERAIKSHDTKDHREFSANKGTKEYPMVANQAIIYDTAANDHFFTDKPKHDYKVKNSVVETADGSKVPIVGQGTVLVGKIQLKDVQHVPKFKKNLMSGTRLMEDGFTTVLKGSKMVVSIGETVVATGTLDTNDRLVKIDALPTDNYFAVLQEDGDMPVCNYSSELHTESLDINLAHSRWGHCSSGILQQTAQSNRITLQGTLRVCETCILTKSNQKAKRKLPRGDAPSLLEVTQIDIQGPFPVMAIDGTSSNIKLIDGHSGYIKMETIANKSASTTADVLRRYKSRMETRTGQHLKTIAVDSGTEFDGGFLALIKDVRLLDSQSSRVHHTSITCLPKRNELTKRY